MEKYLKNRKIITSYIGPDMDGVASMYAYAELLKELGENAEYYYEGNLKKEVGIVLKKFNIKLFTADQITPSDEVILVDNNELKFIPNGISEKQIVEIIDHHPKRKWLENNTKVKYQIEPIGAAATLVAERFKKFNIQPSKKSATLLYYGIISNTMNLKIKMTSDRDREMVSWLKSIALEINDEITREIFIEKSQIGDTLQEEMEIGHKNPTVTIKWSIGQLEVANVDEFLIKYENDIRKILDKVSEENDVEYISVNLMDILNGYNVVIAGNDLTAKMLEENFEFFKFKNLKAKTDRFISRKEIVRVVAEKYKKQ